MIPNRSYPINGVSPLIVGGTGTAIKIFPAVSASLPANPAQPIAPGQLVGGPASLVIPADGSYEGQSFSVVMAGSVTFGATASPTLNLVIQSGSSLTGASNTTIATLTAVFAATISTTINYSVVLRLSGDSGSGRLNASPLLSKAQINGTDEPMTFTALTGISFLKNASTGQNPIFNGNSSPNAVQLVCGVTFGVSDAANSASLMEFDIQ